MDIFYPEPESPGSDRALAEVIKKHKDRLVIALGFEVEQGKVFNGEIENVLYDDAIPVIKNLRQLRPIEAYRVLFPPEPIARFATFGHVYPLPDRDGKHRWENLYIKYGGEYFPSLALQAARIAGGISASKVSIIGGAGVDLGGRLIPTDKFGRLHINYIGREGSIVHRSAADVLSGSIPGGFFRDKIVFIGATAMATYDLKNTPFSANMPGVEKNATVAANILAGDYIKKTPDYLDLLVVLLTGFFAAFIGQKQKALYLSVLYICLAIVIVITNQALFTCYGIRINLIYPLLTVVSTGAFIISCGYFTEEKKAKEIRRMFSSYVTERVVNELIKNPDLARLGGERREVTVLFSDIMDFTKFSERHSPEEVVAMLNEYLGAMTEVIFKWDGTLDKFVGDEIVAFWGAPMKQEDHAELAVRCALNMSKRLEELRQKWRSEGKPALDAGIGINTGEVVVGNIGAEGKKMDYTVIGDHVNVAARVEALTRKHNTGILITEFTLNRIRDLVTKGILYRTSISVKGLERVALRGKEKPVGIYGVTERPFRL
ncbi:MAG TPA: adenylate/guanylate cyclase domain-containing protein [Nitrospirae bacterium]|nr:adenylate cyclase 1 [bacterium BMS3Abin06]HDH10758.1 adenylate/guanylate cyclase domain-containing protein [Nitrospirota bacterium]HDZ03046.1 adenylate/guanylate cyclase domain-containing protein [Nitrospirota bacterium]